MSRKRHNHEFTAPIPKKECYIQSFGRPSGRVRSSWTIKEETDWKHATEMLKEHNHSMGHKEGAICASLPENTGKVVTVVDLQLAATAKQIEAQRQMSCLILQSIYS